MLQRLATPSLFLILLVFCVFTSGVAEANTAPTADTTISDVEIVNSITGEIYAHNYFSDPDGDTLTYTASASDTAIAEVTVGGVGNSTVYILANALGTATITVTVTDPDGATATQTFTVTVVSGNDAPVPVGTIPAQTGKVGGTAPTVDVSSNFSDPDGDTLTYTATSSDETIATVSVSGTTVTITPVAAGTATITVTATDYFEETATQSIAITVTENRAPTAVGTMPNETLILSGAAEYDPRPYFSDPDGDTLTYAATSSNTASSTIVQLQPTFIAVQVALGTSTITVTASDPDGLTATQTFSITVWENQAPTAVGTIPAQVVAASGGTASVAVQTYFSEPEGQKLTYSASSSDTAIATVSELNGTVTITGKAAGTSATATITVTATDPYGLTATQTISVSVKKPPTAVGTIPNISGAVNQAGRDIALSPYFSEPNGQTLTYAASASDTYYVQVYVNSSNELEVTPMAAGNATITVTATNPDGLSATQSFSVAFTASVFVGEADPVPGISSDELSQLGALVTYDTLIFNELHNGSDDTNDYLELRNVTAANLSLDDWALSILIGDGNTVVPFPAGTVVPAGDVLLLVNTAPIGTGDTDGSSVAVDTFTLPQEEFALILQGPSGIGDLAVNYFQGETERSSETAPVLTVDTVWHRKQPVVSGYLAAAWSSSTQGTPGYRHATEMADLNNDGAVDILDLVLVASQFGMNATPAADLNTDGVVNIQDLVLVANAVNDGAAAPTAQQSQAAVVNNWLRLARQTSLRDAFSYTRGIQVLEQLARALVPASTALFANYPNPFNPETWIPYQLAKGSDVTISIYAADGRIVRTLAFGHQDAGMYKTRTQAAYWDGTNAFGELVASGLYFYTLTAGDFTATRKMLILK